MIAVSSSSSHRFLLVTAPPEIFSAGAESRRSDADFPVTFPGTHDVPTAAASKDAPRRCKMRHGNTQRGGKNKEVWERTTCSKPHFQVSLMSKCSPGLSNQIESNYIVRLKVDQRAGQLSLPHLGITKHHSEAPASPEQRGAYRSTSASTVRRQLAAPDAALAAC